MNSKIPRNHWCFQNACNKGVQQGCATTRFSCNVECLREVLEKCNKLLYNNNMARKCFCGAELSGGQTRCRSCSKRHAKSYRDRPSVKLVIAELEDEDNASAPSEWAVVVLPNASAKKIGFPLADGTVLGLKETALGPFGTRAEAEAKAASINKAIEDSLT